MGLTEKEWRVKMSNDFLSYMKIILKKYESRFEDFDPIAFIPLLEERIKEIKEYKFYDNFEETEIFKTLKSVEEIKNSDEYIKLSKND